MAIFQRKYLDKRTGLQRKAKNWTGQYLDAFGVRQRVTLSTDKTAARQMLAELERQVELEKAGLSPINPAQQGFATSVCQRMSTQLLLWPTFRRCAPADWDSEY